MRFKKKKRSKGPTPKWKKNLRLYYTFRVLCSMNFVMPIFILFLIDKGLSTFEIMVTQAVYTLTELILTVPSGAFADKVGRKKTLILSSMFYGAAYLLYAYVGSFWEVIAVEIVFAVSSAAFYGTGEAFLYDTLSEAKKETRYKSVIGTAYAIQGVIMGGAAVAGGWMASHDLSLPFMVSALPAALSLIPLFFLDEPKREKQCDTPHLTLMKTASVFAWRHKKVRNVMYFVSATSFVSFMGFMLYQPLLTDLGMGVKYIGVAMMALSVASAIGNKLASSFERVFKRWDLMFLLTGTRAVLYLLVYLASGYYMMIWAFLIDIICGLSTPLTTEWINRHTKSDHRATVLSISGMASGLSFTMFSPLMGLYVDAYSTQAAYLLLALFIGAYAARQLAFSLYGKYSAKKS